jgi:hypothetical protein
MTRTELLAEAVTVEEYGCCACQNGVWEQSPAGDTMPPGAGAGQGDDDDGGDDDDEAKTAGATQRQQAKRPMATGIREAVFPFDQGQALLQWPERLSPEEFEDFEAWLQIVIRKAKRSIRTDDTNDEQDD